MTLWSRGLGKSCDKLKPLYLYYHSAYCHHNRKILIYFERLPPTKLLDPLGCGPAKLRFKLKPLYIHCHSAYGHQTCQVGDLP